MRYFVVDSTIKDGEYEYLQQTVREAKDEDEAIKMVQKDNNDWIENDWRQDDDYRARECTKDEYEVLKKYIY